MKRSVRLAASTSTSTRSPASNSSARVLEETARDTDAEVKDQSKVARIIAVVLAVVIPASAVFGYLALGRYNAMDPAFLEAVQNQQRQTQGHSQSDMMAAIERLQNRLKETPDDAQTWYMLARTLSNVGRFAEALDAFARSTVWCRTTPTSSPTWPT